MAVVGLVTVMGPLPPAGPPPTEMPAPKLATEVPCTKFVNAPVMETVTLVPGFPVLGLTYRMIGFPLTLKPLIREACSVPVVAATVRGPNAALPAIVN